MVNFDHLLIYSRTQVWFWKWDLWLLYMLIYKSWCNFSTYIWIGKMAAAYIYWIKLSDKKQTKPLSPVLLLGQTWGQQDSSLIRFIVLSK